MSKTSAGMQRYRHKSLSGRVCFKSKNAVKLVLICVTIDLESVYSHMSGRRVKMSHCEFWVLTVLALSTLKFPVPQSPRPASVNLYLFELYLG